jgi:ABC-2 type transport system ATP-binding protein
MTLADLAAIRTTDLSKTFGDRTVVDSLNLSIEQGELFALLGLNGAGKTTLIKMLCCLLTPTSGDAVVLGDSILVDPNAVKQNLNVSPQETAVAPNLTLKENLELIAGVYGSTRREARSLADEMLKSFGLAARAGDKAKTLSGGMQRSLSIAMALITKPTILFLDEPTLGLDVRARRDLWKMISALKGSITIVLTTHYLEEVDALADRVGIMHEGRMRAIGTIEELKTRTGSDSIEDAFLSLTEGAMT